MYVYNEEFISYKITDKAVGSIKSFDINLNSQIHVIKIILLQFLVVTSN